MTRVIKLSEQGKPSSNALTLNDLPFIKDSLIVWVDANNVNLNDTIIDSFIDKQTADWRADIGTVGTATLGSVNNVPVASFRDVGDDFHKRGYALPLIHPNRSAFTIFGVSKNPKTRSISAAEDESQFLYGSDKGTTALLAILAPYTNQDNLRFLSKRSTNSGSSLIELPVGSDDFIAWYAEFDFVNNRMFVEIIDVTSKSINAFTDGAGNTEGNGDIGSALFCRADENANGWAGYSSWRGDVSCFAAMDGIQTTQNKELIYNFLRSRKNKLNAE